MRTTATAPTKCASKKRTEKALGAEESWTLSVLGAAVCVSQRVADAKLKEPIQADRLLAFTNRHALSALVAWHLKRNGQLDELTPPLTEAFTTSFHSSIARAHTQLGALARMLDELRNSGIAAIPWKGPVLAHRIFGETAARECSDLDILIPPECLPDAESILRRLGYLPEVYQSEVRALEDEDHCAAYRHVTWPVVVELHCRPFPRGFPFPLTFDEFYLARNSPRIIGKHSFPVMATECELLLSAAHAAKHLWSRLAWIADIACLAEGMSSAEAATLHELARRSRCHRAVEVSLLLAEDLLGAVIPPPVKSHFAPSAAGRRLARVIGQRILDPETPPEGSPDSPSEWITTQRLRMRSRESLGDRLHIAGCALRYALTPNENDRELPLGIPLPKGFAFLLRPIRVFAKYAIRV